MTTTASEHPDRPSFITVIVRKYFQLSVISTGGESELDRNFIWGVRMHPEYGDKGSPDGPTQGEDRRMTGDHTEGTVLLVDDEEWLIDNWASWLEPRYAVEVATSGTEAKNKLKESIDVVLLDRQMPDVSGDMVLEEIHERGLPCRVAMVTAVEPELDIISLPIDDYRVKPIRKEDMCTMVDALNDLKALDGYLRESYSLVSKKSALEMTHSGTNLADHEAYQTLVRRINELDTRLDETIDTIMTHGGIRSAYQNIEG